MSRPPGPPPPGSTGTGAAYARRRWEWLLVPLVLGAASAALTWDRWIHPFVDGSRELQVPARLAAGERLYRDVAFYYGPAAAWINAAAIRAVGRRFGALEAMGALAAAVLLASLYRLARRAGSALAAGAGVSVAAAICIGAPNGGAFLFPYAFASLFAVAAGFACLAAAAGPASRGRTALGVLALGVALLSKAEIGAAVAAALLLGALRGEEARSARRRTAAILGGGVVFAAVGYAVAFRGVAWADLVSEGPLVLFAPPPEWRQVYRIISGMDSPGASLARGATAAFLGLLVLGAALLASRASAKDGRRAGAADAAWWTLLAAAVALAATAAGGEIEDRLPPLLSPMPIVAAAAALALVARGTRNERERARLLLFAFSALIASRVALNLAYGYVTTPYSILALPGLAVSAAVLGLDVLALRTARPAAFRRALAAAFLALAAVGLVRLDRARRAQPRVAVETPAGTLRLSPVRAEAVRQALDLISSLALPGDTLSGLPEAGLFNFATGLANPLREEQILPGHLDPAAELAVARRIRATGPRFIVLAAEVPPGWAAARFGVDYAREIADEIERHYATIAAPTFPGGSGAVLRVLERRPDHR